MVPAASTSLPVFSLTDELGINLAKKFGTPLYVIDELTFRSTIRRYLSAFKACNPKAELTYASKANSLVALLAIANSEGCKIDVASEGEFRAALAANVPANACNFHGNNKSAEELYFAIKQGIGEIIVDSFKEIQNLYKIGNLGKTKLILRLAPGVDPITHAKISTGQADTKFGFNIADGSAEQAVLQMLDAKLPIIGFHCHVGSQLLDPGAQISGGQIITQFAKAMLQKHGFAASHLNMGGGLGVPYIEGQTPMEVERYCKLLVDAVNGELQGTGLDPVLAQEPGRSLVSPSGVTIYEVGVIKAVPASYGTKVYVAVDGGLSDNPRPALYGSQYTVKAISHPESTGTSIAGLTGSSSEVTKVTVSGKHCETDMLFEGIHLPTSLTEGDLLQVLCTGAYNSSMASNYNRFLRPATVLIRENGNFDLIQKRETWDQLLERDAVPEGLI